MAGKRALLFGASGLVGGELLNLLLASPEYEEVCIIVRRSLGLEHPKLNEVVLDFQNLERYKGYFEVDHVFCCIGTTIKKAKTQDNYYRVDVEYPIQIASLAKEMGAKQFLVISSMGANPKTRVFYTRMKGIMEREVQKIGLASVHIFRPSLLIGFRKELRLGESLAAFIYRKWPGLFRVPFKSYTPIAAATVAKGMLRAAQREAEGVFVYESLAIEEMARD